MREVQYENMYKMLGRTIIDRYNNTIVHESEDEQSDVLDISRGDTMLWHQILRDIGEKGLKSLQGKGIVEGMSNSNLDLTSMTIAYMASRIV